MLRRDRSTNEVFAHSSEATELTELLGIATVNRMNERIEFVDAARGRTVPGHAQFGCRPRSYEMSHQPCVSPLVVGVILALVCGKLPKML
jgi:hypothetical protein